MHKPILTAPELLKVTPIDDILTVSGFEATKDEILSLNCTGFVTSDKYYQCDDLTKYIKLSIDGTMTYGIIIDPEDPDAEPAPAGIYWYTDKQSLKDALKPIEQAIGETIYAIGIHSHVNSIFYHNRDVPNPQDFSQQIVPVISSPVKYWPPDPLTIYPFFVTDRTLL